MATDLFSRFLRLIPKDPLDAGTVVAVDGDSVVVETLGGGRQKVRGVAAVDDKVYFRAGLVEGPAPDLPYYEIEV